MNPVYCISPTLRQPFLISWQIDVVPQNFKVGFCMNYIIIIIFFFKVLQICHAKCQCCKSQRNTCVLIKFRFIIIIKSIYYTCSSAVESKSIKRKSGGGERPSRGSPSHTLRVAALIHLWLRNVLNCPLQRRSCHRTAALSGC